MGVSASARRVSIHCAQSALETQQLSMASRQPFKVAASSAATGWACPSSSFTLSVVSACFADCSGTLPPVDGPAPGGQLKTLLFMRPRGGKRHDPQSLGRQAAHPGGHQLMRNSADLVSFDARPGAATLRDNGKRASFRGRTKPQVAPAALRNSLQ